MLKLGRSVTSERQVMKTITLLCWLPAFFCNPKIESIYYTDMPSLAKLDFVQVCRLSLNVYNNNLRKFTNSATVSSLEQVQHCNPRIDQSADNITGLKCAKECLILKYSISRIPDINLNYTCYINLDADQRNVQNDSLLCCRI